MADDPTKTTRRGFLRGIGGAAASAAGNPLFKILGGLVPETAAASPLKEAIEQRIIRQLNAAKGNPTARLEIIRRAVDELGISDAISTGDLEDEKILETDYSALERLDDALESFAETTDAQGEDIFPEEMQKLDLQDSEAYYGKSHVLIPELLGERNMREDLHYAIEHYREQIHELEDDPWGGDIQELSYASNKLEDDLFNELGKYNPRHIPIDSPAIMERINETYKPMLEEPVPDYLVDTIENFQPSIETYRQSQNEAPLLSDWNKEIIEPLGMPENEGYFSGIGEGLGNLAGLLPYGRMWRGSKALFDTMQKTLQRRQKPSTEISSNVTTQQTPLQIENQQQQIIDRGSDDDIPF
jgi:hypothetical protein